MNITKMQNTIILALSKIQDQYITRGFNWEASMALALSDLKLTNEEFISLMADIRSDCLKELGINDEEES